MLFYRYDDRKFKIGDIITSNNSHYGSDLPIIKRAYRDLITSPEKIVYMYDKISEINDCDMIYSSDYLYTLKTPNYEKRYSDYSPMIAFMDKDCYDIYDLEDYYYNFAKAYTGSIKAKKYLYNIYGVGISNKIEYITDKAEVVSIRNNISLRDASNDFKINNWDFIKNHLPDYSSSPSGVRLYHNTFNSNIDNIINKGLLCNKALEYDNPGKCVWLSEKRALGFEYGGATVTLDIPKNIIEALEEKGLARKVNSSEWTFYCDISPKYISMIDYNLGNREVTLKLSTLIDRLNNYESKAWLIQLYRDHAKAGLLNVSYEDLNALIFLINKNVNIKE